MRRYLSAFFSAFLFALGLGVGGMTDPSKIIAFLDVTGDWDPAMILVMAGAIGVYAAGYRLVMARPAPLLVGDFAIPKTRRPDSRMFVGAAIFGIGWGLAGLCPGPALVSMGNGGVGIVAFVGAMLVGLAIVPSPRKLPAEPAPAPRTRALDEPVTSLYGS